MVYICVIKQLEQRIEWPDKTRSCIKPKCMAPTNYPVAYLGNMAPGIKNDSRFFFAIFCILHRNMQGNATIERQSFKFGALIDGFLFLPQMGRKVKTLEKSCQELEKGN